MGNKLVDGKSNKLRQTIANKNSHNPMNTVEQMRRPIDNKPASTSFQDLFNRKPTTKMDVQHQSNLAEPIAENIVNNNSAANNAGGNGTFEDFFDRFF